MGSVLAQGRLLGMWNTGGYVGNWAVSGQSGFGFAKLFSIRPECCGKRTSHSPPQRNQPVNGALCAQRLSKLRKTNTRRSLGEG